MSLINSITNCVVVPGSLIPVLQAPSLRLHDTEMGA